jgi:hypothetical protein
MTPLTIGEREREREREREQKQEQVSLLSLSLSLSLVPRGREGGRGARATAQPPRRTMSCGQSKSNLYIGWPVMKFLEERRKGGSEGGGEMLTGEVISVACRGRRRRHRRRRPLLRGCTKARCAFDPTVNFSFPFSHSLARTAVPVQQSAAILQFGRKVKMCSTTLLLWRRP